MNIEELIIKRSDKDRPRMGKSLMAGITGVSYPVIGKILEKGDVSKGTKERAYNGIKLWLDDKMSEFMSVK